MANTLIKVGRYQVVSELGRGSMGVVYQGFDPVIGRTIAVKTMLTEGLAPSEFQEFKSRFQREAQAAGVLAHPNIVTVYDFGEDNGVLYLAMEFLEGKSLEHLVEQQNVLPIETIIPMYEQVCSALDHAHSHNIVHRDIKPANIMILENGRVKVTDFGIAKMMSMGMTQAGQILGTPNYMSPEQVKGRQVDGRSDIFSLGVILYELVTGEKPFSGQNITTVIYKIINENPIPPRELDATIHPGLSYVISKVLTKNPDERYQTCRELAEDLKNYKNVEGIVSPSATVVVRVPPFQQAAGPASPPAQAPSQAAPPQPQAAAPAPAQTERELQRPLSVQVIPPARPQAKGMSPVVWVLGTIVIVGALGGGYYQFFMRRESGITTQQPSSVTLPPSLPKQAPEAGPGSATTPSTTPGASTTPAAPASEGSKAAPEPTKTEPAKAAPLPRSAPETGAGKPKAPAPKIGQLIVTANIQGAKISLDGQSESGWVTPHTFADLPSGTHLVVISKQGYDDMQQSVTVEGGRTATVSGELSVPSGEIKVVTIPAGLEVAIDDRPYGPSPVRATVGVGPHAYTIKRPGMDPYKSSFDMKNGAMLTRTVDLSGSGAVPTGIVEVRTIPPGATVYADDAPVGSSTPTSFRLTAGHHTLKISSPGLPPIRREVDVPASGSIQVNATLSRQ